MAKDVMMTIRIPESLRDRYQEAVKKNDETASRHLRGVISAYCDAAEAEFGAVIAECGPRKRVLERHGTAIDAVYYAVGAKKAERRGGRPTITLYCWNYINEERTNTTIDFAGPEVTLVEWVRRVDALGDEEALAMMEKLSDVLNLRWVAKDKEERRTQYPADMKPLTVDDLPLILPC